MFLNHDDLRKWVWPVDNVFLTNLAESVLLWAEERLNERTFSREDYRELCKLIVIFWGGA